MTPADIEHLTIDKQIRAIGAKSVDEYWFWREHGCLPDYSRWRDDGLNTENRQPTISTIVPYAEDKAVESTDLYTLSIVHVDTFHGKAFMPRLAYRGRLHYSNGDTFCIMHHKDAYADALFVGKQWLQEQTERTRREWEAYKE